MTVVTATQNRQSNSSLRAQIDPRIEYLNSKERSADVAKWQMQRALTGESEQATSSHSASQTYLTASCA
jgi:hypothetical protein